MIRITAKAEYALRVVLHLSNSYNKNKRLHLDEISKEQKIPREFLVQIMSLLINSKIVISRKGVGGGYLLGKMPKDISIMDVIVAVDGPVNEFKCGVPNTNCLMDDNCSFRPIWDNITREIAEKLESINFSSIKL